MCKGTPPIPLLSRPPEVFVLWEEDSRAIRHNPASLICGVQFVKIKSRAEGKWHAAALIRQRSPVRFRLAQHLWLGENILGEFQTSRMLSPICEKDRAYNAKNHYYDQWFFVSTAYPLFPSRSPHVTITLWNRPSRRKRRRLLPLAPAFLSMKL